MPHLINHKELFRELQEVEDTEKSDTDFLTLPKVINPYLGFCKLILFSNKKEGLYLALHNKIDLYSTPKKSQLVYINFYKFVQVTKPFTLSLSYKEDVRQEFDLISYNKLEDNQKLDKELEELNLSWYPLEEVTQYLSPIERSYINCMNKPVTFTGIQK